MSFQTWSYKLTRKVLLAGVRILTVSISLLAWVALLLVAVPTCLLLTILILNKKLNKTAQRYLNPRGSGSSQVLSSD